MLKKMEIPRRGYVKPDPNNAEMEKNLRKIATKGGKLFVQWLTVVTALFNAISRGKRMLASIQKENEAKKSLFGCCRFHIEKDRVKVVDAFNEKIEDSKQKLMENQKSEKKWAVLDDQMVEKGADLQNWDTKEENADNWDVDVDL